MLALQITLFVELQMIQERTKVTESCEHAAHGEANWLTVTLELLANARFFLAKNIGVLNGRRMSAPGQCYFSEHYTKRCQVNLKYIKKQPAAA